MVLQFFLEGLKAVIHSQTDLNINNNTGGLFLMLLCRRSNISSSAKHLLHSVGRTLHCRYVLQPEMLGSSLAHRRAFVLENNTQFCITNENNQSDAHFGLIFCLLTSYEVYLRPLFIFCDLYIYDNSTL